MDYQTVMERRPDMTSAVLNELTLIGKINEITRDFEVEVVKMATNPPDEAFMDEIRNHVDNLLNASDVTNEDFIAYCILVNFQRRMKNYEEEEKYIQTYKHIFAPVHPFFSHMELLSMMDNLEAYSIEDILELADKNCRQLTQNNGAKHAYCETVAMLHENRTDRGNIDEAAMKALDVHLDKALYIIDKVIGENHDYAKYYCTKGRLLAVRKRYKEAILNITKAIAIEDSSRSDYTLRVNQYQIHLQQAKNLQALDRTEQQLNEKIQQFETIIEQQSKDSLIKNMEYLGLFAGIISFTIGSIGIASSVATQSLAAAAGLIIVLLGALLCVFAGFGVILHGFNRKSFRNLVVFIMGAVIVLGGVHFCLM